MSRLKKSENTSQEKKQAELIRLKKDFIEVFSSDAGVRVGRALMNWCGFHSVSVVADPTTGEINDRSTLYNEARRNLYLEMRSFLNREIIKAIEVDSIKE